MSELDWASLSDEQRQYINEYITNGCGPKGGPLDPPDWIFNDVCDEHDFYYWVGGSEVDRENVDFLFYKKLKAEISKSSWYLRWWYSVVAYTYYKAVRRWGGPYFEYGPKISQEQLELMVDQWKKLNK